MAFDSGRDLFGFSDRPLTRAGAGGAWTPAVDVYETGAEYVLVAELPGFAPADVDVRVAGTTLTLSGRRPPGDVVAQQFLRLERGQGEFRRAFSFPDAIDAGRIAADFSDGLLTVTVPKAAHAAARRIDIG
jgi:HSP20 family protein